MEPTDNRSGLWLKLQRIAARVKQRQLAAQMGVSESRVSAIEREAVVTPETRARYLDALGICGTQRPEAA